MEGMIEAVKKKDFAAFAELTMKDSNQFHATCLDTYPPIFYLSRVSQQVISLVHGYNRHYGETRVSSCTHNGCAFQQPFINLFTFYIALILN